MNTHIVFHGVCQVGSKRRVLRLILDQLALRREGNLFKSLRVFEALTVKAVSLDQDLANLIEAFKRVYHWRYSTSTDCKTLVQFLTVAAGLQRRRSTRLLDRRRSSTAATVQSQQ